MLLFVCVSISDFQFSVVRVVVNLHFIALVRFALTPIRTHHVPRAIRDRLATDHPQNRPTTSIPTTRAVPDDLHSARRLIDDPDTLDNLERCFRLIHQPYTERHHSLIADLLPVHSVPGSASSLRIRITTYLARFLKRSTFDAVHRRQTRLNHNLFDVIWPAMKTATRRRYDIDEDQNAGCVAPDFDVFVVFQEFLVPLIKDIHCIDAHTEFTPHPERVAYFPADTAEEKDQTDGASSSTPPPTAVLRGVHMNLDAAVGGSGGRPCARDCVAECVRCLEGYELPLNLSVGQLEEVEQLITMRLMTVQFSQALGGASAQQTGQYFSLSEIMEAQSEMRAVLAANRLLVPLYDVGDRGQHAESVAINGAHWPYGRGVFVSADCTLAVWVNVQEHMRVLACSDAAKPGDVGVAHSRVGRAVVYLERVLEFRRSYLLGYLASRPSCLGTALRLSVTLELPHLCREMENLRHLCTVRGLHLQSRGVDGDQSKMGSSVRVSNMQSMAVTEWELFREFCTAVRNVIGMERELSQSNSNQITAMLASVFSRRKKNSLGNV